MQIIVKQETNTIKLVPPLIETGPPRAGRKFRGEEANADQEKTVSGFGLKTVIDAAHVLRASSDITRVRVRRLDPSTKQRQEWTVDLTRVEGGGQPGPAGYPASPPLVGSSPARSLEPDLRLRDGDVIEIPEKR